MTAPSVEPWPEPVPQAVLTPVDATELHTQIVSATRPTEIVPLIGYEISGSLDLQKVASTKSLVFEYCRFIEQINIEDASFAGITFTCCHFVGGIAGSGLKLANRLEIKGCWAGAPLDFSGAHVGKLSLGGSTFQCATVNPVSHELYALNLSIMTVDRSVDAQGIRVFGILKMVGCNIGGECDLASSTFLSDRSGVAIGLREVTIARSLTALDVTVVGQIRAVGAKIGGEFDLGGAYVVTQGRPANDRHALDFLSLSTGRWLNLSNAVIEGSVRLSAATIKGKVQLRSTRLMSPAGTPPTAPSVELAGISIGRDLELSHGAEIDRQLSLPNAQIGASFDVAGMKVHGEHAVFASGAKIGNELRWQGVTLVDDASVDLHDVSATRLVDDPDSWGSSGSRNLVLSGLTFTALGAADSDDDDVDARLRWLRKQQTFDLAPYRTVARVLKGEGQDKQSRQLEIKGEWDRLRRGNVRFAGQVWGYFFGLVTGFGYSLWRALLILIVCLLAAGWYVQANRVDLTASVPTASVAANASDGKPPAAPTTVNAQDDRCAAGSPCFDGWLYVVHAVIPGLSIGHLDDWKASRGALVVVILLQLVFWLLAGALAGALAKLVTRRE